jgi:hypothetical protein
MSTSLFSPRVRRFGERLSLLIFFAGALWFFWQCWQFREGGATERMWASLGLGGLCSLQFAVLLWVQHRRRMLERSGG